MNHHYVPAFYLRAFTDPACPSGYAAYLWLADVQSGQIRRRAPHNAAALTDYYAIGEGENRYQVEEHLQEVENLAAPIIATTCRQSEPVNGPVFTADEKAILSTFTALQITRVPRFRTFIQESLTDIGQTMLAMMLVSRERFESVLRDSNPGEDYTPARIDELYMAARTFRVSANPDAALGHALNIVPEVERILSRMSWAVLMADSDRHFWTSDCPVFWINPESSHPVIGHGLSARGVEVTFPLGPDHCLLMSWTGMQGRQRSAEMRGLQERGISNASRYCSAALRQTLKMRSQHMERPTRADAVGSNPPLTLVHCVLNPPL